MHQRMIRSLASLATLALAVVMGGGLSPLAAQSAGVPSSEAEAFLGEWTLPLDTGQGMAINVLIAIEDSDGQVSAGLSSDMSPEVSEATGVSMSGESLILNYEVSAQGQALPVQLTLTPSGEDLAAEVDAGNGMFFMEGTATRP